MLAELPFPAAWLKPGFTVVCLAALWSWETLHPFFLRSRGRLRHAMHNLAIAIFNTVLMGLLFGSATVLVAQWTVQNGYGLLHLRELPSALQLVLAVALLDAWLYAWHRANHRFPLLWRFHRTHHADNEMDVTTATRFHFGEHLGASVLRIGLIPLLGFELWHLLIFETLVVGMTMFHHANISLGRWDAPLRCLIVTPFMHKVHHSRWRPETDSNYSILFSFWDRLFQSFRMREDCSTIELGLDDFNDPRWQTFGGMLTTPFITPATTSHASQSATPPNPEDGIS